MAALVLVLVSLLVSLLVSVLAARPAAASDFTDYAAEPGLGGEHADVFRLYWAFFDREPDGAGARYWVGERNRCVSLTVISESFQQSAEFALRYGTVDNAQMVELVYQNVLDRPADPGGAAYWLGLLNNGTLSRGGLMVQFSLSAEFRNAHPLPSDGRPFTCSPPAVVTVPPPVLVAPPASVYYANCSAVRAAGKAPLYRGQPGYRSGLDADNDGLACETGR